MSSLPPAPRNIRPDTWQVVLLMGSFSVCLFSGLGLWALAEWVPKNPFSATGHPLKTPLLALHLSGMALLLIGLGSLIPWHLRVIVRRPLNLGGLHLALGLSFLLFSGLNMLVVLPEDWANGMRWLHRGLGVGVPLLVGAHLRRSRAAIKVKV
ncbi:MAG: hypothetical protein RRB13_10445 [bacterium]|nr:hypothetical protein [bacterium]